MKYPFKINPETQCWEWDGLKDKDGYGRWSNGRSGPIGIRQWRTHRLAYLFRYGVIPEGKSILHKCNNPSCVNWDHLYAGDHDQNMQDRKSAGNYLVGAAHPDAKYTDDQVRIIMANPHFNDSALARKMGVTRTFVRNVRLGLTRTHITGGPLIKERVQGWQKGSKRTDETGRELPEPVLVIPA